MYILIFVTSCSF